MDRRYAALFAAALCVTALTGCGIARDNIHRDDYLASHDLPADTAQRIASKRISVGMSKSEVRAAWGPAIVKSDTNEGTVWNYSTGIKLGTGGLPGRKFAQFGPSGRVIAWEQPR